MRTRLAHRVGMPAPRARESEVDRYDGGAIGEANATQRSRVTESGIVPAHTASVALVHALLRALERGGADPVEVARRGAAVSAVELDRGSRVSANALLDIWSSAEALTGDRWFGVHVATSDVIGSYGALDFVTRSAADLGEGLAETVRYFSLLSEMSDLTLEEAPAGARLVHAMGYGDIVDLRQATECLFATIMVRARRLTGSPELAASGLRLRHSRPSAGAVLEELFRCDVEFDAPENELSFSHATLATPLVTAEPALHDVLVRHAEALVAGLAPRQGPTFVSRVRAAASDALADGPASLANVARRLGASPRTVQRRLQQACITFEEILEPLRRDLALHHVARDEKSISQIASLVGFSEPSAFYRAFRRWTGTTPRSYRAAARNA